MSRLNQAFLRELGCSESDSEQRTTAVLLGPLRRPSPSSQQLLNKLQEKQQYVAEEEKEKALTGWEVDSQEPQEQNNVFYKQSSKGTPLH